MTNISKFLTKFLLPLSIDDFLDPSKLESILLESGLNDEILNEQPPELKQYFGTGYGLKIWQYPNQFVPYLIFLSKYSNKIDSYLEIGCRHGGTFIFTTEFLNKISNKNISSVACDILTPHPNIIEYVDMNKKSKYYSIDSNSTEFKDLISNQKFSLALIDADHSYQSVKQDTELVMDSADIIVLHDIVSSVCPGVVKYWQEFKNSYSSMFNFYEFIDQYDSVKNSFLGIGCAVNKKIDIT